MLVDPLDTRVTKPVLSTVATAVAEEIHGVDSAGDPVPDNWVVDPATLQRLNRPEIVGIAFTVTVTLAVHPLMSV